MLGLCPDPSPWPWMPCGPGPALSTILACWSAPGPSDARATARIRQQVAPDVQTQPGTRVLLPAQPFSCTGPATPPAPAELSERLSLTSSRHHARWDGETEAGCVELPSWAGGPKGGALSATPQGLLELDEGQE